MTLLKEVIPLETTESIFLVKALVPTKEIIQTEVQHNAVQKLQKENMHQEKVTQVIVLQAELTDVDKR